MKKKKAKQSNNDPSLDRETLRIAREIYESIQLQERGIGWAGKTLPVEQKLVLLSARVPADVNAKLRALPGRLGHHVEKALRLYVEAMTIDE